jgi:hypothetical protein
MGRRKKSIENSHRKEELFTEKNLGNHLRYSSQMKQHQKVGKTISVIA